MDEERAQCICYLLLKFTPGYVHRHCFQFNPPLRDYRNLQKLLAHKNLGGGGCGLKQINSCRKVLLQEASLRVCIAFYELYSSSPPPLPLEVAHVQNVNDYDDVALLLSYLQQGQSSDRFCFSQ